MPLTLANKLINLHSRLGLKFERRNLTYTDALGHQVTDYVLAAPFTPKPNLKTLDVALEKVSEYLSKSMHTISRAEQRTPLIFHVEGNEENGLIGNHIVIANIDALYHEQSIARLLRVHKK